MKKVITLLFFVLILGISISAQDKKPFYEVYALKYAELKTLSPTSGWTLGAPVKDSTKIVFMIWLIKGDNGKNILVDAGCAGDLPNAVDFGLVHYLRPDSILLQLGIKAEDITDIIISHPHWDHIDGITFFPKANIWIQKDDYDYFVGQAWQKGANHGGFVKADILNLVNLNVSGSVTLVKGDNVEILPGIKVYTGSRHTYNSQYAVVLSGIDKIVIASDNIWIYDNLEKMYPPPSYGTFNAKAYVAAMQRMKTLASKPELIIPGHDDQLFSKFPKITERIVRIK
jgi:glyoxylase-like metal-dependent hydrolase (beta-lactamase superfamily II)